MSSRPLFYHYWIILYCLKKDCQFVLKKHFLPKIGESQLPKTFWNLKKLKFGGGTRTPRRRRRQPLEGVLHSVLLHGMAIASSSLHIPVRKHQGDNIQRRRNLRTSSHVALLSADCVGRSMLNEHPWMAHPFNNWMFIVTGVLTYNCQS